MEQVEWQTVIYNRIYFSYLSLFMQTTSSHLSKGRVTTRFDFEHWTIIILSVAR